MSLQLALRSVLAATLLWCGTAVHAESYTIPLFVGTSAGGDPQGVLRLVNGADAAATVSIHTIDDAGVRTGPATLTLAALSAVDLSAAELQAGSAAKGLSTGLGSLVGDVRLVIDSDAPIVPSAFVRSADGALSAVNATVHEAAGAVHSAGAAHDAYLFDVAVFHAAINVTQPSRLRLINPNDAPAQVVIDAWDDSGAAASGGTVQLTVPPGGARTLTSLQLEAGDAAGISGRLGAGVGNWRLSVAADRPIQVVNVAVGAGTGYWSNLSTTAVAGWAPQDAASFEARFLDRKIVVRDGKHRLELRILPGNRFRNVGFAGGVEVSEEGRYRYERTGRDAGRLFFEYDGGELCETNSYFASPTSGWFASGCIDGNERVEESSGGAWLTLDASAAALDLGPGPDDWTLTVGAVIDALALPAASGGDGALTYSLSPDVPGLRFDPITRRLTATLSEAGAWFMTYRVRDASGDTDWRYFNFNVSGDTDEAGSLGTCHVGQTVGIGQSCTYPDTADAFSVNVRGRGSFLGRLAGIRIDVSNESIDGRVYDFRASHQGDGVWRIDRVAGSTEPPMNGGAGGGGQTTTHGVGETLSDLPMGSWTPDVTSGGSFSLSGGAATVRLDEGGYIEEGDYRYTCQGSGGCVIENRSVTSGTVVQTASGTVSGAGSGGGGDTERKEWRKVIFHSFQVSDTSLTAGQSFTLEATLQKRVGDQGIENLRYFRSLDPIIDPGDAVIYSDWRWSEPESTAVLPVSLDWTAPPYAGTYYYGVCSGWELELSECSNGVRVTVEGNVDGVPDLSIVPPHVSHFSVAPGSPFTWTARTENTGTGPAAATSLRYYLSDDTTIDATDMLSGILVVPYRKPEEGHTHIYTSNIPSVEGTYYVGFCVDPVPGETNFENNCSAGVSLIVESVGGSPDLIVRLPIFDMPNRNTGDPRIGPAVINLGSAASAETVVRLYRSEDATFDAANTPYETYNIGSIALETIGYAWFEPSFPSLGTYHFTACVDPVRGESDTDNNCSETVPVNVGVPDLAVSLAWVSTSALVADESFNLTATVRNQGTEATGSTNLRYYRSDDSTIDATDTPVGADDIRSLTGLNGRYGGPGNRPAASGASRESISVRAPSIPGTYYYGACVDVVPGEANTDNNCSAGMHVRVVPSGEDPFNIELVFDEGIIEAHKDVMQQAARRWETIVTEGLPDVDFSTNRFVVLDDDGNVRTTVDDVVDDLRIFVHWTELNGAVGRGGPDYVRSGNPTGLPALGEVWIAPSFFARRTELPFFQVERLLQDLMLHEIAHVLGFGTLWEDLGLVHEPFGDAYFSGELAINAFNVAGGEDYRRNKVPLESGFLGGAACAVAAHWNPYVFRGLDREFGAELMEPTMEQEHALSAITVQSIADLGYIVDVSKADPYRLPASVSTIRPPTASAKPVAGHGSLDFGAHDDTIYVGNEQGQIIRTIEP